jgi:hypothetical protein
MLNLSKVALLGAISLIVGAARPSVVHSEPVDDFSRTLLQGSSYPDERFIMASLSARALRHLAIARQEILRKQIPNARRDLTRAMTLINDINAGLSTAKVETLISTATVHLAYEHPKEVATDLDAMIPSLAEIKNPAVSREVKGHLEKAQAYLKKGNKASAKHELTAAMDVLNDTAAARPLALVHQHLEQAQKELISRHLESANRSLKAAENTLKFITLRVDTPLFQTHRSLLQATRDYMAGRWSAAKKDIERANRYLQQAIKTASADSRAELQDLSHDIHALLNTSTESKQKFARLIRGSLRKSEALAERALDYETAAWEKFRANGPDSSALIEAKLHVALAETSAFTVGDHDKASAELEKADSYLQAIEKENIALEPKVSAIEQTLKTAEANVSKNDATQSERYDAIERQLTRLIH